MCVHVRVYYQLLSTRSLAGSVEALSGWPPQMPTPVVHSEALDALGMTFLTLETPSFSHQNPKESPCFYLRVEVCFPLILPLEPKAWFPFHAEGSRDRQSCHSGMALRQYPAPESKTPSGMAFFFF